MAAGAAEGYQSRAGSLTVRGQFSVSVIALLTTVAKPAATSGNIVTVQQC